MIDLKVLIAGNGEIGSSLYQLMINREIEVEMIDPPKAIYPRDGYNPTILEVCFPYTNCSEFYEGIKRCLIEHPTIKVIIINSTIDPFAFSDIPDECPEVYFVHSPVRGTHPNLTQDLQTLVKFVGLIYPVKIGYKDFTIEDFIDCYYTKLGIKYKWFESYHETAFAKLVNTTWYGMEIAFATEIYRICVHYHLNFDQVYTQLMETDFIGRKYIEKDGRFMATHRIERPVMYPGKLGGHCILPNLTILQNHLQTSELYRFILSEHEFMSDGKCACKVGYLGTPIKEYSFISTKKLLEFLQTLRPANKRPSHLIVEGVSKEQVKDIAENVLYASQVFLKTMNAIQGGCSYTRRYLCRHFKYDDGGDL